MLPYLKKIIIIIHSKTNSSRLEGSHHVKLTFRALARQLPNNLLYILKWFGRSFRHRVNRLNFKSDSWRLKFPRWKTQGARMRPISSFLLSLHSAFSLFTFSRFTLSLSLSVFLFINRWQANPISFLFLLLWVPRICTFTIKLLGVSKMK